MKKALVCLLAVLLCLGMAACGEDKGSSSSQESSSSQQSSSQDSSSSQQSSSSQEESEDPLLEVSAEEFRTAFNDAMGDNYIGNWESSESEDATFYLENLGGGVTVMLSEKNDKKKAEYVVCDMDLSQENLDSELSVNAMMAMVVAACPGTNELDAIAVLDGLKLTDETEDSVWNGENHTEIFDQDGYLYALILEGSTWSFMIAME